MKNQNDIWMLHPLQPEIHDLDRRDLVLYAIYTTIFAGLCFVTGWLTHIFYLKMKGL
jgi:hypothetical protein